MTCFWQAMQCILEARNAALDDRDPAERKIEATDSLSIPLHRHGRSRSVTTASMSSEALKSSMLATKLKLQGTLQDADVELLFENRFKYVHTRREKLEEVGLHEAILAIIKIVQGISPR